VTDEGIHSLFWIINLSLFRIASDVGFSNNNQKATELIMKNAITVKRRGTPRGVGVNYLAMSGGLKQIFHADATDESAFAEVASKFSKVIGYASEEFAVGVLEENVRVFVSVKKETQVEVDSEG
jgi:hypothetical protein